MSRQQLNETNIEMPPTHNGVVTRSQGVKMENYKERKNSFILPPHKLEDDPMEDEVTQSTAVSTKKIEKKRRNSLSELFSPETQGNLENYGLDTLRNLFRREAFWYAPDPLGNHDVSGRLRSKMVDWMIEVLSIYEHHHESYFLAVSIFDHYMTKTNRILTNEDVHITGAIAMFLASKHEEIKPLYMRSMINKVCHKAFTKDQLIAKELEVCRALNFRITHVTPFNFLEWIELFFKEKFARSDISKILEMLSMQAIQNARLALLYVDVLKWKSSQIAVSSYLLAIEQHIDNCDKFQ